MRGLRSICFIYRKENAYDACYLKEFFKWIGFSYLDCLNVESGLLSKHPEKAMFDVIVNINSGMSEEDEMELAKTLSSHFIDLSVVGSMKDDQILDTLLRKIIDELSLNERSELLLRLANIYEKHRLVSVLYEYSSVLLEKLGEEEYEDAYRRFEAALHNLETVLRENRMGDPKEDTFLEYVLYAKYFCQRNLNTLLRMQGRMLDYNVDEYMEKVNEIYSYDESFFKVEYLKAKAAQQDCQYNAFFAFFMERCIEQCPVDICRSYYYYSLAKWSETNRQHIEASKAYRLSYYNNPTNIKAIFKIAVENREIGKQELAVQFFEEIINIWRDQDEMGMMPPREIEYTYKVRMLISKAKDIHLKGNYIDSAEKYLQFIRKLKDPKNVQEHYFIKRLYGTQERIEKMCNAMLGRLDQQCLKEF